MKPWTWKQIVEKSEDADTCDAFVKQYGKIGAVALELASRLECPGPDTKDFEEYTRACGCAMCKQWHFGWSDERVRKHYKKLYFAQYYGKNLKP